MFKNFQTCAPSKGCSSPWLPSSNLRKNNKLLEECVTLKIYLKKKNCPGHQPYFNVCVSSILLAEGNVGSLLPGVESLL